MCSNDREMDATLKVEGKAQVLGSDQKNNLINSNSCEVITGIRVENERDFSVNAMMAAENYTIVGQESREIINKVEGHTLDTYQDRDSNFSQNPLIINQTNAVTYSDSCERDTKIKIKDERHFSAYEVMTADADEMDVNTKVKVEVWDSANDQENETNLSPFPVMMVQNKNFVDNDNSKGDLKNEILEESSWLEKTYTEVECRSQMSCVPNFMVKNEEKIPVPKRRKTWDAELMQKAVAAVRNKEMGYLKAAKTFNVPQTTLERYVKATDKTPAEVSGTNMGRKPLFPPELENDLVQYCLVMADRFFGVTRADIRRLAYQLAKKNGIPNSFNKDIELAGEKWLRNFLKRHLVLSLRAPQRKSAARVKSSTEENVNTFFNLLEPQMKKVDYNPNRIYNCDETGFTIVQRKIIKVLAVKGKKRVASLTSAERGGLITAVTCMNAVGHFVPPMLIFPRKNMKQELMDGTPPGSTSACHISGWIQSDIFTEWFKHFIQITKPTSDDPVILILDGHFSHTRNLDVINLARENNVSIMCLPPHSANKLQPLGVAFIRPLKTYYRQEIKTWLTNHIGRTVTVYQIGSLFGKAYQRAASAETASCGFRKTGIYPFNPNIFRHQDFAIHESEGQQVLVENEDHEGPDSTQVTDSPRTLSIEQKSKKADKTLPKAKQTLARQTKVTKATRKGKKCIVESSSSEEEDDVVLLESEEEWGNESDDNDDAECFYCAGLFSEDREGETWIRCCKCFKWAHTVCAGEISKKFYCEKCVNKGKK